VPKQTIDIRGGGSGRPRYDGWYPRLILDKPLEWKPTVADVHTNPREATVLEVGVGNPSFLVVAIDNQGDRAAYVGPVYSYYEFHQPARSRLTDEQWQERIKNGKAPPHATWTSAFRPPAATRDLGYPPPRTGASEKKAPDPREKKLKDLQRRAAQARDPKARARLFEQHRKLMEESRRPPLPTP
jgi:hypothetical protein